MKFLAILLFIGAAAAEQSGCTVGEWSDWSKCMVPTTCEGAKSFPSDAPVYGSRVMDAMMKYKQQKRDEMRECRELEACPMYLSRPSSGSVPCVGGFAGDLPCLNIDQLSFLNIPDLGVDERLEPYSEAAGSDIWGWTDKEFNEEYAIIALSAATVFVRITDPYNPVPLGIVYSETAASIWRDVKTVGNFAYIVSEAANHGLQVYDMTRLRGRNSLVEDLPDATHTGFGQAHNIVANEETNFIYGVGSTRRLGYPNICQGGLYAIDVSDPFNPVYAGCYGGDGYVHDAQCIIYNGPDTTYVGREICFCYNEDTFTIVDVEDKANMALLSRTGYLSAEYTHQGWVTEDHTTVLLDDELDEQYGTTPRTKTYLWDVTDLNNPELKRTYLHEVDSIDHNQYIIGDLTFQANYESGLRILSIDQVNYDLNLVALFDVFPDRDTAEFSGSWSVYPYFSSGNVVVSSIEYGLFVLRPDYAAINAKAAVKAPVPVGMVSRQRELISKPAGVTCEPRMEYAPCLAEPVC